MAGDESEVGVGVRRVREIFSPADGHHLAAAVQGPAVGDVALGGGGRQDVADQLYRLPGARPHPLRFAACAAPGGICANTCIPYVRLGYGKCGKVG